MQQDVYFKKEVALTYEGHRLRLRVAQELFSSAEVDVGTRLLLRTLGQGDRGTFAKVLDLGSGYGPLGLALKKADNARLVHMVDRDALAVDYTRQNAELNRLSGVEVYGSLGYDDVSARDFDLIVSNVPAKAGESAISHFLLGAVHYLSPGGVVAVVIIAPLASTVAGILDREANIEVLFRRDTPTYTVLHYRFSSPSDGSGRSEASGMAEARVRPGQGDGLLSRRAVCPGDRLRPAGVRLPRLPEPALDGGHRGHHQRGGCGARRRVQSRTGACRRRPVEAGKARRDQPGRPRPA